MRRSVPNIGPFGRALGFVAAAAIVVAIAIHLRRGDEVARALLAPPSAPSDPLAQELARCQGIGMAAGDDAGCKSVWAENRRRFFASPPANADIGAPPTEQKASTKVEGR